MGLLNSIILFAAYLLGALIFILDLIKKYEDIANANPDPKIQYKGFWKKERWNILQIILWGVVAVILLPWFLGGHSVALHNKDGEDVWHMPVKSALIPMLIFAGWTGGRVIMNMLGKSGKELYKKVGIDDK